MTIGDRLRVHRRRRGLTLKAVASHSGFSVSYVADIERGRRSCPPATAARLAVAAGADPCSFVQDLLEPELAEIGLEVVVRKSFRGVP